MNPNQYTNNFTPAFTEYNSFLVKKGIDIIHKNPAYYLKKYKFFDHIMQMLPGSVYILNYQTKQYMYVSEGCEAITGYTAKDFLEKGNDFFTTNIHPDDFKLYSSSAFKNFIEHVRNLDEATKKTARFSLSYRFKRKDGNYIHALQQYVILETSEDGFPLLALGYFTDITSHKQSDKVVFSMSFYDKEKGFSTITPETFPSPELQLSTRESEVLKYIVKGFTSKQIADKLYISHLTVNAHRRNILKKTGTKRIAELVQIALRKGLC